MSEAELLIAGLLVAVAGLSALARQLAIPYPIVLVVGGALLGFIPGLPEVELNPEVVLVIFLPPLLHSSSIFADFGFLRRPAAGWRSDLWSDGRSPRSASARLTPR